MAQLKTADILGSIDDPVSKPKPKKSRSRAPKSPTKSSDIDERKEKAREASVGKPSAYEASLRAKLRDKTQLNFGGIPRFVREEFETLAEKNDMKMREYLYHLLRKEGADIPAYNEMDGRRL